MNSLVVTHNHILSMNDRAIAKVQQLEAYVGGFEQAQVDTSHVIHGGMYLRTMKFPAGMAVVGAIIKVPTTLILSGHAALVVGDKAVELEGYHVFAAEANRKQALFAIKDTCVTMMFATNAKTVEEAEEEFTDEPDQLMSRKNMNKNAILITGEQKCVAQQ